MSQIIEPGKGIPGDIPGTRGAIVGATTKFNIYFPMAIALLGGILYLVGMLLAARDNVPETDAHLLSGLGGVCFSLFFPWAVSSYFSRHFLVSIRRLEQEVAELKRQRRE
jgi:hypothetical protein